MAQKVAVTISGLTTANFDQFIIPAPSGIKIDAKCLELGVPLEGIWRKVYNIIQRRNPEPAELDAKARDRARRSFEKVQVAFPAEAEQVRARLAGDDLLVSSSANQLRLAELVRTYYIFLNKHFSKAVPDPWGGLQSVRAAGDSATLLCFLRLSLCQGLCDLAGHGAIEEETYRRIVSDSQEVAGNDKVEEDPKEKLFTEYLNLLRCVRFGGTGKFGLRRAPGALRSESAPAVRLLQQSFPTARWMAADVRSESRSRLSRIGCEVGRANQRSTFVPSVTCSFSWKS